MYVQCTGPDPVIMPFPNYTVCLNIDNHLVHAFYSTFDFNLFIGHQVVKHSRRMSKKAPRALHKPVLAGVKITNIITG